MNRIEHLAHNLHQRSAESTALYAALESKPVKSVLGVARSGVRHYYERFGKSGRYQWNTVEELAAEALKRGAMQKKSELAGLLGLLTEDRPKTVLEIGTARGGTFFALAQIAVAKAHLISIDLPGGDFGGGYGPRGAKRLQSYCLPTQRISLMQGNSHDESIHRDVEGLVKDTKIDFCLIDGDHGAEGALRDWELYSPLVASGGIVAFHDINPNATDPRCEVPQVWDAISRNHSSQEIIEPAAHDGTGRWGGIGVIRIP